MNECKRNCERTWKLVTRTLTILTIYLDYFLPSRTININLFNNEVLLSIVSLNSGHLDLPVWPHFLPHLLNLPYSEARHLKVLKAAKTTKFAYEGHVNFLHQSIAHSLLKWL